MRCSSPTLIRDHAHEGIRVGDVLDDVPLRAAGGEHKPFYFNETGIVTIRLREYVMAD